MRSEQDVSLGAEFDRPTREQWLTLVDKVLAGAPFERKLVSHTYDDLAIQPLYTATNVTGSATAPPSFPVDAPFPRGRSATGGAVGEWDIRQHHAGTDLAALNEAILTDLAGGVTSIELGPIISTDRSAAETEEALGRALQGVHLDLAPICLDWGNQYDAGALALESLWERAGIPASSALGEFGADPLGDWSTSGNAEVPDLSDALTLAVRVAGRYGDGVAALRVDGLHYANAGASDAQELAFATATGIAYLRGLTQSGLSIDVALGQIVFRLAATTDQFATTAKLRAARRMWARVAQAWGATPAARGMRIQAVTALAYYSQRDVQVNTLRATLAAFGAAIGGADSVTVLPFGAASGIWDKAGCRLARNTHIILAEESGLGQVIDPAGGSWFVEQFSEDLAAKGWEALQEIERRGGIGAILASGWAAAEVERTWHRRLHNIVRRKDALTGVSEFPNLTDPAPPASLDASSDRQTNPFPLRRHSAPFEHLRDAADLPTQRPSVFLAALGPLSAHGPRAQFAMNFFAAGGIAAENSNGEGFNSAAEVAAAFGLTAPRPPLVVICSSDEYYAEHAVSTAQALKASGCTRLYLAGNPGERRAEFESAGVDEFVYIGCDAIDVLGRALQASGIEITGNAEANAR